MKSDPMIQVKDSAAWTIGRICEQVPSTVLHLEVLNHLLPALIDGLKRETRVATNICWVMFTYTMYMYYIDLLIQANEKLHECHYIYFKQYLHAFVY